MRAKEFGTLPTQEQLKTDPDLETMRIGRRHENVHHENGAIGAGIGHDAKIWIKAPAADWLRQTQASGESRFVRFLRRCH